MSSQFEVVCQAPPIEVFALNKAYAEDENPNKVNLGVGAYRTDEGKPWVLPVVKKVEKDLANDETQNHEYLPVLGLDSFTTAATALALGPSSAVIVEGRAFGIQTLSGTGALRVTAECLARILKRKTFYFSKPSWENHQLIFINAGFTDGFEYRYWDPSTRSLDFEGMIEDLKAASPNSVVIFHACAHNPTGCDPSKEQWKIIEEVVRKKNLFPLFDTAYQGFATGSLEADSWALRYFAESGHELAVTQSFAKNFGLYNERVGNLTMVVSNKEVIPALRSQIALLIRGMYSNPPNHGARIVSTILNNPGLFAEWEECIQKMVNRIMEMRKGLRQKLLTLGTPSKNQWKHIVDQIGMFSYTGLTVKGTFAVAAAQELKMIHSCKNFMDFLLDLGRLIIAVLCNTEFTFQGKESPKYIRNPKKLQQQVEYLKCKYHIYMLRTGRINICGLTTKNLDYVARAIHETILLYPEDKSF